MARVTHLSPIVAIPDDVRASWNSPMQKRIIIWLPALAILAVAMVVAGMVPAAHGRPPAAEQH
jgi:hypothetical protein